MAQITTSELKNYLRVEVNDEDDVIAQVLSSATSLCVDVARVTDTAVFYELPEARAAILYAAAYLYAHREEADHHELTLQLRSLLFGVREVIF